MEGKNVNIIWSFISVFIAICIGIVFSWYFSTEERPNIQIPPDVGITSSEVLPKNPQQGDSKVYFGEGSDFERMKKQGNSVSKNPPIQPYLNGSYTVNTNRMVTYMKNNAFKIELNTPIKKGFLHFHIRTNGSTAGKLFFYFAKDQNTGDSGYIDISSAIYSKYNSDDKSYDLLFEISRIRFLPWGKTELENLSLIQKLSYFGRSNYISTFWVNNKNSYIEQITLAYDEDR